MILGSRDPNGEYSTIKVIEQVIGLAVLALPIPRWYNADDILIEELIKTRTIFPEART